MNHYTLLHCDDRRGILTVIRGPRHNIEYSYYFTIFTFWAFGSSELFLSEFVRCPSSLFSHFYLLLQNHWTNFNQICHKASLSEEDSSLFRCRAPPHFKGDDYAILKKNWRNFKIFFSRTTAPISTKFGTMHPLVKGFKFVQMKVLALLQGEIITKYS